MKKNEKFINFEPIDEIEEDFEIKNSKLLKITQDNIVNYNKSLKKHPVGSHNTNNISINSKNILTPNKNLKKNKSIIGDKNNDHLKIRSKILQTTKSKSNYISKLSDNKKSFIEVNRILKLSNDKEINYENKFKKQNNEPFKSIDLNIKKAAKSLKNDKEKSVSKLGMINS